MVVRILITLILLLTSASAESMYEAQKEIGAQNVVMHAYHLWCESCSLRWATRLDQPYTWYRKTTAVQECPTYVSQYRDQNYASASRMTWRCEEESLALDTGRVRTRWLMNAEHYDSLLVWESAQRDRCDTLYRNRCGDWLCASFYVEPPSTLSITVSLLRAYWLHYVEDRR